MEQLLCIESYVRQLGRTRIQEEHKTHKKQPGSNNNNQGIIIANILGAIMLGPALSQTIFMVYLSSWILRGISALCLLFLVAFGTHKCVLIFEIRASEVRQLAFDKGDILLRLCFLPGCCLELRGPRQVSPRPLAQVGWSRMRQKGCG